MAKELENPVLVEEEELDLEDTLSERFMDWVRTDLIWYAGSFTFHLLLMSSLLLFSVSSTVVTITDETSIEATEKKPKQKPETDPVPKDKMDLGEPPLDPTELNTDTLTMEKPAVPEVKEEYNDESEHFEHRGGGSLTATSGDPTLGSGGGLNIKAWGPGAKVTGPGGVQGKGFGGSGLGGRGSGHRAAQIGTGGGTKQGEAAVGLALNWLWRHQDKYDGGWTFHNYKKQCSDGSCTGAGGAHADAGATGMALLCFLGPGKPIRARAPTAGTSSRG